MSDLNLFTNPKSKIRIEGEGIIPAYLLIPRLSKDSTVPSTAFASQNGYEVDPILSPKNIGQYIN